MNTSVLFLIIIIIAVFLLIYAIIFNAFQNYVLRIEEVEINIDDALRGKFDVLKRILKSNEKSYQSLLDKLNNLKNEQLPSFDFDRALTELCDEFCELDDNDDKKKPTQAYKKYCIELREANEKILAYKHYYNNNIIKFNKLVKIFPTNLVAKISHFEERKFYDGKDLEGFVIDDLKI